MLINLLLWEIGSHSIKRSWHDHDNMINIFIPGFCWCLSTIFDIYIGHFAIGFFITTVDNSQNHSLKDLKDQYINVLLTYYSHVSVSFDLSNQPCMP